LNFSSVTKTDATCGNSNGSAIATATGGTGSLIYTWSNSATGQTTSTLNIGTYVISVIDANNCSATQSVSITNTTPPNTNGTIVTDVLCKGDASGSISVIATGAAPFTYNWPASAGTTASVPTVTNLLAGTYVVTVEDINGCKSIMFLTINEPPTSVVINPVITSNATCGNSDGSAVANAAGGTGTLNYTWSNSVTGQTANNLAAGIYFLTVSDANNCTATQSVNINNNSAPTISNILSTNLSCNGDHSGSIAVSANGTSTLTYSWNPVTATTATINNLSAGNYSVTITDASGCQVATSVTLAEPPAISLTSAVITNATCGNNNGSITTTATGGTGSLTYSWAFPSGNNTAGSSITNLATGIYTLTVTDISGCTKVFMDSVGNSGGPLAILSIASAITCNGGTGNVTVNTSSGTAPYTYSWSIGTTSITTSNQSTIINQQSANYSVTVTDANGCTSISTINLPEPTAIVIDTILATNASCGLNNGMTTASASGGTGTLTYSWSNGDSGITASNLSFGSYDVSVTDLNGCQQTKNIKIINSTGPKISSLTWTNVLCKGGNTGSAIVTASGTATLTYSWSSSSGTTASGQSLTNALAGIYTVTVTDGLGCIATSAVLIAEPGSNITANLTTVNASCGNNNGSISANASGGTGIFTYTWNFGSTTQSVQNLAAADYTVTITDANGCSLAASATIISVPGPVATAGTSQATITAGNTTLLIGSGGGNYLWMPSSSLTCNNCANPTAQPTATTTYTLIVSDSNGCLDTADVTITVKEACGDEKDLFIANVFSPNGDGKNDVINIEGNGLVNIYWAIYDRWGNLVFDTTDLAQGWDGTKNGASMETGVYVYYLKAMCSKTNTEIKIKGNISILR